MTEPASFLLRPHRPNDIERLCGLDRDARKRYTALKGFETAASAPAIAANRFAVGKTFIAEIDGGPVGYVLAHPLDGMLYIASIAVAHNASGLGIGLALLRRAEKQAHAASLPALVLTTFRMPRWNGPWFRRQGFTDFPKERIGPGLQAILERHAGFLDMSMRETLWKQLPG